MRRIANASPRDPSVFTGRSPSPSVTRVPVDLDASPTLDFGLYQSVADNDDDDISVVAEKRDVRRWWPG